MKLEDLPGYSSEDWHRDLERERAGETIACPNCGHAEWYRPIGIPPEDGSERKYRACKGYGFWQEAHGTPAYAPSHNVSHYEIRAAYSCGASPGAQWISISSATTTSSCTSGRMSTSGFTKRAPFRLSISSPIVIWKANRAKSHTASRLLRADPARRLALEPMAPSGRPLRGLARFHVESLSHLNTGNITVS